MLKIFACTWRRILCVLTVMMALASVTAASTNEAAKDDNRKFLQEYNSNNEEMYEQIFSDDTEDAIEALNYFHEHKAHWIVLAGLDHFSITVQAHAALLVKDFDDRRMVPRLIRALEWNNHMLMGGSEVQIPHRQLKINLVAALDHLTGLHFRGVFVDSDTMIKQVIDQSRDWLERNPPD